MTNTYNVKRTRLAGSGFIRTSPRAFVYWVLFGWSTFQLWYASPLPFIFDFFILNESEARSVHLAIPLSLVFLTIPLFRESGKSRVTLLNMIIGLTATFSAGYLFFFYDALATRSGKPTDFDIVAAFIGIVLLLEGTRRVLGFTLMVVTLVFILYAFAGSVMPDVLAHKGVGIKKAVSHYWLGTQGVFGIALGVSNSLVFMFVLFGALLEVAGGGNYFIRSAYALMGKFKGGPGKAAVAASALTGMVSGSSTANVVTTGTFTIPLMRKIGFSAEKAGAIEVASSTNGQLMPPVMGAAAFLMAEYVGISYLEVIKHAFLPALISYIALAYIVHLEASKLGMQGLQKNTTRSLASKMMLSVFGFLVMTLIAAFTYYGIGWIKAVAGDSTFAVMSVLLVLTYVALLALACRVPELPNDLEITEIPPVFATLQSGCYFLLPIIVLMWCLTIERLSPSLSAFWGTCFLLFIVISQRPLKYLIRRQMGIATTQENSTLIQGGKDLVNGLVFGARNMVGIALATATAGIIVGTVTLTGVGFVLTEFIEVISGGSLILVLVFTALISLVLGMGLPTTANYIVVSTLMAPVIVNLSAEAGLVVPLIAAHLFVFYFGILADDTPPVGLAAYAAASISGGDPIKTGIQGFSYDIRTAILPFIFLFNTELLMIGVQDWWHVIVVILSATAAMLIFCAATQRYMLTHNKVWETVLLLIISLMIFRPGLVWDKVYPPTVEHPPSQLTQIAGTAADNAQLQILVRGEDFDDGSIYQKVVVLPLGLKSTKSNRLQNSGLELREEEQKYYVDNIGFDSHAQKAGFDFDQEILSIQAAADRPRKEFVYLIALGLFGIVFMRQRQRTNKKML